MREQNIAKHKSFANTFFQELNIYYGSATHGIKYIAAQTIFSELCTVSS